jgi:alpha-L-fucosidase
MKNIILSLLSITVTTICAEETNNKAIYASVTASSKASNTQEEKVQEGIFKPSWESLKENYKFPEWYRDAKFGIWAHWGPQCAPEHGDWYARNMYAQLNKKGEKNENYQYHLSTYGHPSTFGFKDIIPLWKAENWDPNELVSFYKKCGAKYFMALANHHDNFDTWDSKHQSWNSVNLGPHKDIIKGWSEAAKKEGLPFGMSFHAARAWSWNSNSINCDSFGDKTGVPYDGVQTASDGMGKWWDGLDPQELYSQDHATKAKPSKEYIRKYFNRVADAINKYHPELIYFDDDITRGLPLQSDDPTTGLKIASHFYNDNMLQHNGELTGLILGKKLPPDQRGCILYGIERGVADEIMPEPWQSETCIGTWHYDKGVGEKNRYKKPKEIISLLCDVVSKNGNLMLSVPVKSDGTIDKNERAIVTEVGDWLSKNGEAIYATRPWRVFGENHRETNSTGGTGGTIAPITSAPITSAPITSVTKTEEKIPKDGDIRFSQSKDGKKIYAVIFGKRKEMTLITSIKPSDKIKSVELINKHEKLEWKQNSDGLTIEYPPQSTTAKTGENINSPEAIAIAVVITIEN